MHLFVPTADMLGQNPNKPYADFTPAYLQSLGLQKSDGSSNAGSAGTTACAASNNTQWWFNNYCGSTSAVNGAPIVATNGQIPLSQLDPNMLALASVFPKPNITPTAGNPFNYQFVNSTPQNRWEVRRFEATGISRRRIACMFPTTGKMKRTSITSVCGGGQAIRCRTPQRCRRNRFRTCGPPASCMNSRRH